MIELNKTSRLERKLKMKKNIIKIMVCAFVVAFAFTGSSMAKDTGKKAAAPAAQKKPADDTKAAAPATDEKPAAAEQVAMTGTVEKTDAGIVIKTADAVYTVTGKDLAKMVGKTVNATGTVDKQTITVTEVKEAKNK